MAADGTVKILIQADGKEAIGTADALNAAFKRIPGGTNAASAGVSGLKSRIMSIAGGIGVVNLLSKAIGTVKDSISGAVSRFDTLNKYPVVMKALGYSTNDVAKSAKTLSNGIDGLPTSLDEITKSSQQLAPLTGGANSAAKAAVALNDAFLASGASVSDTSRGMEQYTQMLSSGKVDMMSWKTLMETMPVALTQVAKSFGFTGKSAKLDLYNALQSGTITIDQLNDKFVELDKSQNGFAELARKNSVGIGTSFANLKTAVVKNLANMLTAIDTGLQKSGLPKMAVMIDSLKGAINTSFSAINQTIQSSIPPIVSTISGLISFVSKNKDWLLPLTIGIVAFATSLKAISVAATVMSTLSKSMTVLRVASSVAGDMNLLKFALGNMAGESKLAAVGLKALNAVLSLNPWAILAAAIVAVVAGLTYFFTKTQTGQKLWAQFVGWLKQAGPVFSALGNSIKELVTAGLAKLAPVLTAVGSAVGKLAPFFSQAASAVGSFVSAGIDKLGAWFGAIAESAGALLQSGLSKIGPLMDSMGGAFGKVGALIGPVVSVITKLGLAALGITGPWGVAISVIASFLGMWAKTGELNADGITAVFSSITSTITNAANGISKYLPQFIAIGTQLLVSLINGITAAIPQMVTAATSIINGLTSAIAVALPAIITAGTQILLMLIQAITAALPSLVAAGVQIINGLVNAIVTVLPILVSAGLQLILALVQGIVAVLPMLITAALQIVMALFNGLVAALPTIISAGLQILLALVNGIVAALPTIITAAIQIILALFNALVAALPQIIAAGIQILLALINGIISILPALVSAAVQIIISLFSALIANLPKIISAGIELLLALVQGLIKMIPALLSGVVQIIAALFGALIDNAPKILSAGVQLIKALISGLLQLLGQVGSAAMRLGAKVIGAIKDKASDMASAGVDFVKGFIGGIGSMVSNVVQAAENLGRKAVDGVKKFLHIGSPSRVMRQIGVWTGEGFTNGIKEMLPRVSAMSDKMADAAMISTPSVDLGGVSGSIPRFTSAEQLIGGFNQSVPSMQTINNYTSTTNNSGSSDKVLDLLQQIADKSPIIDGASVSGGLAPFMSAQTAARTKTARRGGAVIARIQ